MLQQTTVKTVGPYYAKFLARWPDIASLAAAPLDDVLRAWAGLGYYARARNLHACARAVAENHGGKIPAAEAELRQLPGIGAYTAAAIAAIAYDVAAMPVDGNVERVIARLYAVTTPLPAAKPEISKLARALAPPQRAGDFAQAMMDLGATICTPKKPACALCPWNDSCAAHRRGDPEIFPRRIPKREGTLRRGAAFVARRADGFVLLRTPAGERPARRHDRSADDGVDGRFRRKKRRCKSAPRFSPQEAGESGGAFPVRCATCSRIFRSNSPFMWPTLPARAQAPKGARWIAIAELAGEALPSLMRKVLAHVLRLTSDRIDKIQPGKDHP